MYLCIYVYMHVCMYVGMYCFVGSALRRYMRNGLDGGGQFMPADIVGVHTLSLLLSSRVGHDRATEDNHTQQIESLILSL